MSKNIRGNGGRKFLMLALGTTAGAVVALLTAPGSGKEMRRRLGSVLQQAREKASNMSGALAESISRGTDALKDGVIGKSVATSQFNSPTAATRAARSNNSSSPR